MRILSVLLFLLMLSPAWADDIYNHAYDAGYIWAEDKELTDARDCGNDDNPFVDGCAAWCNEYTEGYTTATDEHYDDRADCHGTKAEIAGCESFVDAHE